MKNEKSKKVKVLDIEVNSASLDLAIEKASRLVELLQEASTIISSLFPNHLSES